KAERSEQNPHSHIINVVPLKDLASSNLVVSLEDAPYPVILHLIADSPLASTRTTDALLTFRLQGQGPLAKVNLEAGELKTEYHNELLGFIHGLPNPEAKALGLDPPEPLTKLWSLKDKLYLRTQADLIHPAWIAVAQGEDLNVYVLPKTRALVLAKDGQSRTLRIVGPKPKEQ
ncbi:MAG: hypothetical protein IJS50_02780, partial [Desulfovibrio sp.]|nr:hypothetical protein [Desulfovibrio sp.]